MTDRHREWLEAFFTKMLEAGFANITIDDDDLEALSVDAFGTEAVIDELAKVDDMLYVTAEYPRIEGEVTPYDEPYRVRMALLTCNSPWETLVDHTIPCERVLERLDEIVNSLEGEFS